MSPDARWIPFTAAEFVDATGSNFRWEASLDPGKLAPTTVIDAYEDGRGYLLIKLGGLLPVKKVTGAYSDKAELQRYLASVLLCPTMLLNHPTLECTEEASRTLTLRDRHDPTGAALWLELSCDGRPIRSCADRPRLVGKRSVLTPWVATANEFREYEGLRIPTHLQAAWTLPDGEFIYFREQITSFEIKR